MMFDPNSCSANRSKHGLAKACSSETPKKSRYALSESEARVKRFRNKLRSMEATASWRLKAALDATQHGQVANQRQLNEAIQALEDGFHFVQEETKILNDTLSHSVKRQDRICRRLRDLEAEVANWDDTFSAY